MKPKALLNQTVAMAKTMLAQNQGGPFAALIARDGVIIAQGYNAVTSSHDPTAHAEIVAIRAACERLNTHKLNDCEIYTSCEPCPMCLGAIYWARIKTIYYGATHEDAKAIGFDDALLYDEMRKSIKDRSLPAIQIAQEDAQEMMRLWQQKQDKIIY